MSGDDQAYMRRAIDLARAVLGATGENPAVGCVIVKDGEVLAEAATARGGRPHAEEQALAMAGERARGAVAYVTLDEGVTLTGNLIGLTEDDLRVGLEVRAVFERNGEGDAPALRFTVVV